MQVPGSDPLSWGMDYSTEPTERRKARHVATGCSRHRDSGNDSFGVDKYAGLRSDVLGLGDVFIHVVAKLGTTPVS